MAGRDGGKNYCYHLSSVVSKLGEVHCGEDLVSGTLKEGLKWQEKGSIMSYQVAAASIEGKSAKGLNTLNYS